MTTVSRTESLREGRYSEVNGLRMYYEVHGSGAPLVLLHGALMTIEGFGPLLPALAEGRQVIAVELQGHGRTADIDRPFSYEQMADDVAELLRQLRIGNADVLGYSLGGGVALQIGIRYPELVRKLVIISAAFSVDGSYPEVLEAEEAMAPESLEDTEWFEVYRRVAPDPSAWPRLIEKVKQLDARFRGWPEGVVDAIRAPALVVIGDSDIVLPEHAVRMFRLLGGGVPGDLTGLPHSQLAVLPGTTHITMMERAAWLAPMVAEFLDAPVAERG